MSSNNKSKSKKVLKKQKVDGVNNRIYSQAINNIKKLWVQYNLDDDMHYIPTDSSYINVQNHLKTFAIKFDDLPEYHPYVIEHMLCFLDHPKAKTHKLALWRQIMNKIKLYGLHNTYDIIKKYTDCHLYASASDITLMFDGDTNRITQYLRELKNYSNITDVMIGLYDNNINRIIIDAVILNDIIFDNFKTIRIVDLEPFYPIDRTIKKISIILSDPSSKKIPKIYDKEKSLFAKYIFTYADSKDIQQLIKNYNVPIRDEYVIYYLSNETWDLNIFDWLVKSGANPDIKSIMRAYKIYTTGKRRYKLNYKEEGYLKLLESRINEL